MSTRADDRTETRTACESPAAALIAAQYALASAHTEIHSFTYGGFAKDIEILRHRSKTAQPPGHRQNRFKLTSRLIALNHYVSHLIDRAKEKP